MKKYTTIPAIVISTLLFTSMAWADNTGKDVEDDVVQGHGAVSATKGEAYDRAQVRSNETGDDLLSNTEDARMTDSGMSGPAVPGADSHDDHDDELHALTKH